jgi:hypothetical protein
VPFSVYRLRRLRRVLKRTPSVDMFPQCWEASVRQDLQSQNEREIRAARNQSLFRAVNEQIRAVNETFGATSSMFAIACECADVSCIETLEIPSAEYAAVRADPRQFAVLRGHVYPEVEKVVRELEQYVVVEKIAAAAEVAERLAERH